MSKRISNNEMCRMKVAELRQFASSNDIPIKNPDGKMKLKCDLLIDLLKADIPTTSPEYNWLEEPEPKPRRFKKKKVIIDEDENFVDLSDQRYAKRIQDEAGVSFSSTPNVLEFIPDEELKKRRKYPKNMTSKIDGQPVLLSEEGLLEFVPRKVRNKMERKQSSKPKKTKIIKVEKFEEDV